MSDSPLHTSVSPVCFIGFNQPVDAIPVPDRFTFPFYYEPTPLCVLAAAELQAKLKQEDWDHTFGVNYEKKGVIGKMFGVLVVRDAAHKLGYLAAFSGKLTAGNDIPFVPPVVDLATEGRFFLEGEQALNRINEQVEELKQSPGFLEAIVLLAEETENAAADRDSCKQQIKAGKEARKIRREVELTAAEEEDLRKESLNEQYYLKDLNRRWKKRLADLQEKVAVYQSEIAHLKTVRKSKSAALQQQLFERYTFLNTSGNTQNLLELFRGRAAVQPPSGAGECAAPKLLQYAFKNGLQPIAIAEFWWGQSPSSEIRRHGNFYPACRGKCEPILGHMLQGLNVEENPLLEALAAEKTLSIVYEDEHLLVVNKPAEFLSVPGIAVSDSVYTRMKAAYPQATGPLIVHRLDMSTSGALLIAKTREVHAHLQRQFLARTIQKRYVALLDGILQQDEGIIELPLRLDIDDRPRQLVCFKHGKPALTKWKIVAVYDQKTKVYFYPHTGRTHQLRVHAAHALGLNLPISGDDIYGTKSDRLYLHAESIGFQHPVSGEFLEIQVPADF